MAVIKPVNANARRDPGKEHTQLRRTASFIDMILKSDPARSVGHFSFTPLPVFAAPAYSWPKWS
jgi:hypothetical protein